MKKIPHYIILLVLPISFIIVSLICKTSAGEFYLNNQYDPSYVYLLNSLNLSQLNGYGVGRIVHPGTTVYEMGAIIIYFLHTISASNNDIVTEVFTKPEFYFSNISLVFIFMNSIALFILGIVSFKKLKNIYLALFLQFTPFFATTFYYWIINPSPEPLLTFTVLILLILIISYTADDDLKNRSIIKYAIGFGLICGFGLATKISFFPLLIIPVILIKKISFKALFCLITLVVFIIFFLPVLPESNPYRFLNWLKKLTLFSGKYGTGEKNFIDSSNFLKNLYTIFTKEIVFSISYMLISITFLLQLIPKLRQKIKSNKYHKLLIGIFAAMTIQIFIVSKHFEIHYLLPVNLLIITGMFIVNSIAFDLFPRLFKINKYFNLSIILIVFIFIQTISFLNSNSYITQRRDASHESIKYLVNNFKDYTIVSSYGASSQAFALYLGALLGGAQKYNYYSILKNMFPNNYYYDISSTNLENVYEISTVKNKLISSKKFVFHCGNEADLKDFIEAVKTITDKQNITFKKFFQNRFGETIYEIVLDP